MPVQFYLALYLTGKTQFLGSLLISLSTGKSIIKKAFLFTFAPLNVSAWIIICRWRAKLVRYVKINFPSLTEKLTRYLLIRRKLLIIDPISIPIRNADEILRDIPKSGTIKSNINTAVHSNGIQNVYASNFNFKNSSILIQHGRYVFLVTEII